MIGIGDEVGGGGFGVHTIIVRGTAERSSRDSPRSKSPPWNAGRRGSAAPLLDANSAESKCAGSGHADSWLSREATAVNSRGRVFESPDFVRWKKHRPTLRVGRGKSWEIRFRGLAKPRPRRLTAVASR